MFLPASYHEGYGERWHNFDRAPDRPAKLFGFLGALVQAMQNWNDNGLSRMPGVRDRVVRVRLAENEGGLNLNMPPELITSLSELGREAAGVLEQRFLAPGTGWDEQRFVRLSVLVKVLEQKLEGLSRAWSNHPHATDYSALGSRCGTMCCGIGWECTEAGWKSTRYPCPP